MIGVLAIVFLILDFCSRLTVLTLNRDSPWIAHDRVSDLGFLFAFNSSRFFLNRDSACDSDRVC